MLKLHRKDLVKDFEDLVKQEIKNHNDAVLASNVSINEMREKIERLKSEYDHKNSIIAATVTKQSENLVEISQIIERAVNLVNRRISDNYELQKQELEDAKKSSALRESYYLTINEFKSFSSRVDEWIAQIRCLFDVQQSSLSQAIEKAKEEHHCQTEEVEKKWVRRLCDEMNRLIEMDQNLDRFAVEFAGIKEMVEKINNRCFIAEKNIENLYTQIERLKSKFLGEIE